MSENLDFDFLQESKSKYEQEMYKRLLSSYEDYMSGKQPKVSSPSAPEQQTEMSLMPSMTPLLDRINNPNLPPMPQQQKTPNAFDKFGMYMADVDKSIASGAMRGLQQIKDFATWFWMDEKGPLGSVSKKITPSMQYVAKKFAPVADVMLSDNADTKAIEGIIDAVESVQDFQFPFQGYEPQTLVGSLSKPLVDYGVRYGLQHLASGGAINPLLAGLLVNVTNDPYETRISNVIQEHPSMEKFRNPITEFMAANPNDPEAVARLKSSIEGGLLDLIGEGVFKGIGWLGGKSLNALDNAIAKGSVDEVIEKSADEVISGLATAKTLINASDNPEGAALASQFAQKLQSAKSFDDMPRIMAEMDDYIINTTKEIPGVVDDVQMPLGFTIEPEVPTAYKQILDNLGLDESDVIGGFDDGMRITQARLNQALSRKAMQEDDAMEDLIDAMYKNIEVTDDGTTVVLREAQPKVPKLTDIYDDETAAWITSRKPLPPGRFEIDPATGKKRFMPAPEEIAEEMKQTGKLAMVKDGAEYKIYKVEDLVETERANDLFSILEDELGSITLESPAFIGGGALGGITGTFVDYNGDGKVDMNDIAVGTIFGVIAGGTIDVGRYGFKQIKKLTKGKGAKEVIEQTANSLAPQTSTKYFRTPEEAFPVYKQEVIARIDSYIGKFNDLLKGNLDEKQVTEINGKIELLQGWKQNVDDFKSFEGFVSAIKSPELKAELERMVAPAVQVIDADPTKLVANWNVNSLNQSIALNFDNIRDINTLNKVTDSLYNELTQGNLKPILDNIIAQENAVKSALAKGKKVNPAPDVFQKLADKIGIPDSVLRTRMAGDSNVKARVLAFDIALTEADNTLNSLVNDIMMTSNPSPKQLLNMRRQMAVRSGIAANAAGIDEIVNRSTRSLGILRGADTVENIAEINRLLNTLGGYEKNTTILKQYMDLDPAQRQVFATTVGSSHRMENAAWAFTAAKLWNPRTWIGNVASNGAMLIDSIVTTGVAEVGGSTLRMLNKNRPIGVTSGETWALTQGIIGATRDAVSAAVYRIKTGRPVLALQDFNTKIEFGSTEILDWVRQIDSDGTIQKGLSFFESASRNGKNALGFGARVQQAGDDMANIFASRGSLRQQAYREASSIVDKMGLKGREAAERIKELTEYYVTHPNDEMILKAKEFAGEVTFTTDLDSKKSVISGLGAHAQQFANEHPGARFIIPFIRTGTNIADTIHYRTPVINKLSKIANNIRKYGTQAEKDLLVAKESVAGLLMLAGFGMVLSGRITGGGGRNYGNDKKIAGWQPYSIKVGDTYVSYDRLDMQGTWLGIMADIGEIVLNAEDEEDKQLAVTAGALAIAQNLASRTFFNSVLQGMDAIDKGDPKAALKYIGRQFGSGWVPTILPAVEKVFDPTVRETNVMQEDNAIFREVFTVLNDIKSRIPGLSQTLPPRRDILGEEVTNSRLDIINPYTTSTDPNDDIRTLIAELEIDTTKITGPMKALHGVNLSPEQYDRYMILTGEYVKEEMRELLDSGALEDRDVEYRKSRVRKAINKSKANAGRDLLDEFPDLDEAIEALEE